MTHEDLRKRVHEANIRVHRVEAKYYDRIHPDIINKHERERTVSTLKRVDKIIKRNQKKALDFGAGTGNLTGKLLHMNYEVTAVDISKEMCEILKERYKRFIDIRKLTVVHSKIEDMTFDRNQFDMVCCYSVLHHLPDYLGTVRELTSLVKKGGAIYLDLEASPFSWSESKRHPTMTRVRFVSDWIINYLTRIVYTRGARVPPLDYSMSDYWTKETNHIEHDEIRNIFEEEKFDYYVREDFYLYRTKIPNPFFYAYEAICKPDMSLWIARK